MKFVKNLLWWINMRDVKYRGKKLFQKYRNQTIEIEQDRKVVVVLLKLLFFLDPMPQIPWTKNACWLFIWRPTFDLKKGEKSLIAAVVFKTWYIYPADNSCNNRKFRSVTVHLCKSPVLCCGCAEYHFHTKTCDIFSGRRPVFSRWSCLPYFTNLNRCN